MTFFNGDIMFGWYQKYYWQTGFKTRFYDWLTPECYFESMREALALLPAKNGLKIWDVGCGSGMLLKFLKENLNHGRVYYGSDLLFDGLKCVKNRAKDLKISSQVVCFQNDMTGATPFAENTIDIIIAHFSIYTISGVENRQQALKNLYLSLKPNGSLILVCPSENYDAGKIIKESFKLLRIRRGYLVAMIKRIFLYPLTKTLGLNFIQRQLKSGNWIAYSKKELSEEMGRAGYVTGAAIGVYAGAAYLMHGIKKCKL